MKKQKKIIMLPGIHYRLEAPELLQGALMLAVGLSAAPVLQETLGLSYDAAMAAVFIAEALGLLHVLFRDPVVPGWITSALSLVLVYLGGYAVGIESVHALIALQLTVSALFLILGATGIANKMVRLVPPSLKAGILLGAAIAALARVFGGNGYLEQYPVSVASGSVTALFVLFSVMSKKMKDKRRAWREISKYGMLSSLVVSMILGFATGELQLPAISWGITKMDFADLFKSASVFSTGLPSLNTFLSALPVALAVYIVAFGEIVTAQSVLDECREARPDEEIEFNPNRTNIITGVRNLILALFSPFTALAGPLWAAVTVSVGERYKEGNKSMRKIYGGMGSFKLSTALCVLFLPITSLLEPVLPVALAVTLVVQGFACSYMAFEQVKDDRTAAGSAGITGAVVYLAGSGWGLATGILCWLILEGGISKFNLNISGHIERRRKMEGKNLVIAIDQEYCGGGRELAEALSEELKLPCYEKEILTKAAELSGIPQRLFEKYDGVSVNAAYDFSAADESEIKLPAASRFPAALADAGRFFARQRSCILVDHFAGAVLQGEQNCFRIFVCRDASERLKVSGITEKELKIADRKRRQYHRAFYRGWGEADSYDICLDMTGLDVHKAAKLVLQKLTPDHFSAA